MNIDHSIIWRRLDIPGHETARIYGDGDRWYLDGAAIFVFEHKPCRLEYLIECGPDWRTAFVNIDGWVGDDLIEIEISVSDRGGWVLNGEKIAAVRGCSDIDLNFSPVTNLLPIRRLNISAGELKKVRAAWLRFPSFDLEPLDQIYTALDETTVLYESGSGTRFTTELKVDGTGLVVEYPGYWKSEP